MNANVVTSPPSVGSSVAKILLVDDHPIVRQGLANLINATPDLRVSGEASSAAEALTLIAADPPDVAVIDISLEDPQRRRIDQGHRRPFSQGQVPRLVDVRRVDVRGAGAQSRRTRIHHEAGRGQAGDHRHPPRAGGAYLRERADGDAPGGPDGAPARRRGTPDGQPDRPASWEIPHRCSVAAKAPATSPRNYSWSVKTVEAHRERLKEKLKLKSGTELLRYAVQFTLDHPGK